MRKLVLTGKNNRVSEIEEALLVGVIRKAFLVKVVLELSFDIRGEFQ